MGLLRDIFLVLVSIMFVVLFLGWLGLRFKPKTFPAYPEIAPGLITVPLPPGLPIPVERFYRAVYGAEIPVIEMAVIKGRAVIRPFMNIPFQARFVFVHNAGKDYRHYIEASFFGLPLLKVNEGYVDGKSFFESPMGTYYDDPNTNQGANLALWAEAAWFPSLWVTDPRARWESIDDNTALLYVPYEQGEENFVVRFNPQTGLLDLMEAMRCREAGKSNAKILWIISSLNGKTISGTKLSAVGAATWLDQGRPWAIFTLEEVKYNVDVSEYIRQRGQ
jgi:hypothetical protein